MDHNSLRFKAAFTLLELLVSLAILGIIVALVFPVLGSVREQGRRIACINNLRQHGMAWQMYLEEHNWCFPAFGVPSSGKTGTAVFGGKRGSWPEGTHGAQFRALNRYCEITGSDSPAVQLFHCPADTKASYPSINPTLTTFNYDGNSYWFSEDIIFYNPAGFAQWEPRPFSTITRPHDRVYLERDNEDNTPGHGGKGRQGDNKTPVMVLFVDGHVAGPFLYNTEFEPGNAIDNAKKVLSDVNGIPGDHN